MSAPEALVISGGGRFTDPWHPFAETSAALAAALGERGYAVEIADDADARLAALPQALPSLLVVNLGWYGPEQLAGPAADGLIAGLRTGLPTLLVHSTLTAFPAWPQWRDIAGGGWTDGTTYHPDYGPAVVLPVPDHPLTAGLDPQLEITDERYTRLWVAPSSTVFVEHDEAGARHPLGWTRLWGASPVVADALGHDAAAYRSPGRRALLERELDWLERPGT